MKRAIVLVLLAGAVVLGRSPSVAGACSCADRGLDAQVERADVVLVGTVVAQEPSGEEVHDAVRRTVEVERVYVGEADPEVAVLGGETSGRGCEYGFAEGRYLIIGSQDGAGIHTDLCSGTRPLAADEEVPEELGAGVDPEWPPIGGPDGDVVDDGLPLVPVAGGLLVAGAAGAVIVLVARRGLASRR